VLRLMGNGDSNKIIAETLSITMDTTKKHVRNVIDKMQTRSLTRPLSLPRQALQGRLSVVWLRPNLSLGQYKRFGSILNIYHRRSKLV
jgi:hypothetical protein